MLSIIIIIIGISILILVHELGHFLAAKYFGVQVEEFGLGFPPRIISKKIRETRYSINWLPIGGFVKLHGEFQSDDKNSFVKQKAWRRAIILVAGVTMNFLIGWLLLSLVFFIGAPNFILVNKVLENSLAAEAGILAGDQIIGFDTAKDLTDFLKKNSGKAVILSIQRGESNQLEIKVVPQETIGVMISDVGLPAQPFFSAIINGFTNSFFIMFSILAALGNIFNTPQNFVGPIGIFNIALETGKLGAIYVFQLLALISLNLAVLNLLPVPALDGGRLFFLLIEKIKGSTISSRRELFWNTGGFIFLIGLIIIITILDVVKLF